MYDNHLSSFPRLYGETEDSARIQRAIDATADGILCIPKGTYEIKSPLFIKNHCSLDMHPAAKLIATEEMDFVLTYDGNSNFVALTVYDDEGKIYDNLGLFIRGTLSNISLHNGKNTVFALAVPLAEDFTSW